MIRWGRVECDGCGEVHRLCDYEPGRDLREYLERRAEESGWLVRFGRHYCRTCKFAVKFDSLAAKEG